MWTQRSRSPIQPHGGVLLYLDRQLLVDSQPGLRGILRLDGSQGVPEGPREEASPAGGTPGISEGAPTRFWLTFWAARAIL